MVMYSIFKTGLEGETAKIENLRQAERYLPDNIYTAIENFRKADWTTKLLGAEVKGRYADLKQASADRCARRKPRAPNLPRGNSTSAKVCGTCDAGLRELPLDASRRDGARAPTGSHPARSV
jgi:hypothetical protein